MSGKTKLSVKKNKKTFGIVMASDKKYLTYLRTTIKSIRKYNLTLPINIYSCDKINSLTNQKDPHCQIVKVAPPKKLKTSLDPAEFEHALSRIAKLDSMTKSNFEKLVYLDSDTIALSDVKKIYKELETPEGHKPIVYLLLRRPQEIPITQISWLYFKDSSNLSPKQMANLVNNTFSTNYSPKQLLNIKCWNGGVVYGSLKGVRLLSKLWKKLYLKMLTGKNRKSFIPNDQLCLWIAIDQLKDKLAIKELPLTWNFMPGHALEEIIKNPNPSLREIKKALTGIKILHLAQNKTDIWAQVFINETNSEQI